MAKRDTDKMISDYIAAYTAANGVAPKFTVTFSPGWFALNDYDYPQRVRPSKLLKMTETLRARAVMAA